MARAWSSEAGCTEVSLASGKLCLSLLKWDSLSFRPLKLAAAWLELPGTATTLCNSRGSLQLVSGGRVWACPFLLGQSKATWWQCGQGTCLQSETWSLPAWLPQCWQAGSVAASYLCVPKSWSPLSPGTACRAVTSCFSQAAGTSPSWPFGVCRLRKCCAGGRAQPYLWHWFWLAWPPHSLGWGGSWGSWREKRRCAAARRASL